ncbi:MAG: polysaccharide biosynthesis tyrosine autokinase [Clostridia bacterium]|nr:polysaccharide biosynthesis tyrosine autokinase [Clostridia bacterium]MBQ8333757.1 polysaccharide biosynthesis tyrosine autokinase [Clostridia bacterium]MBQ8370320.1 polysaccharide biosynthesis tyrosine autokinase [Clostridia bacterium]MBQ8513403.1 polysaccharide biosynthesis tyrosine autokinase [Clostridia bacterium]
MNSHTYNDKQHDKKDSAQAEEQLLELDLEGFFRALLKFWWVCLILAVIGAGLMFYKSYVKFVPVYKSSVTFTVKTQEIGVSGSGISSYSFYYDRSTASQLASTFPSIMQSNILSDIICRDLGVSWMPATLSASSVSGTNMFTMTATGYDPQLTYDVLLSAMKNYPEVSSYVIGNTTLEILTEPTFPETPSNSTAYQKQILLGAGAGLILGLGWVLLYTLLRQTIRTREDVKARLNQHCIAVLPRVIFKKYKREINRSVLMTNPLVDSGFLESLRAMRNSVLNIAGDKKVIMVSSTAPGEGKTTTAVNLALSLSKSDRRVLLIDCDLRNPSVCGMLNIESKVSDPEDIFSTGITRLSGTNLNILTFNTDAHALWKVLKVERLRNLFDSLRPDYDFIIVDTSPCGLTSDPSIVAQAVDAALFVINHDTIRTSRIVYALDTLTSAGVPILGCILNGLDRGFSGYGNYGYRYGRYGRYGYGKYGYGKYGYGRYGYGRYGYGYGDRKKHEEKETNESDE